MLQAVHIPHSLEERDNQWHIMVEENQHRLAVQHIAAFEQENRQWPPAKAAPASSLPSQPWQAAPLFVMVALVIFYGFTGAWHDSNGWFQAGANNSEMIKEHGQWWRLITALTLHADPVHLLGNVFIGAMLLHFLGRVVGPGMGLLLAGLAGLAGNGLNILWRHAPHLSVGFSTALFGAVGILCGLEMKRAPTLKGLLPPLGAGLGLLAMLGTSGEHTDLGAHLWGLIAGLLLGYTFARLPPGFQRRLRHGYVQLCCLILLLALTGTSWLLALA
ncbi:MAG: rhomboid family intramembrane serine protease [Thermodesulfobacteriota bacterium]